jgi:predicted nucleic acid-binding protein
MKTVFADTFYFLALLDSTEAKHSAAVSLSRDGAIQIVTTEWILTEFADAYSHPVDRSDFIALYRLMKIHPRVKIIMADTRLFQCAIEFFEQHRDKAWSLTDCTSFVVMRDESIRECLTGDRHFEQAGFVALLK